MVGPLLKIEVEGVFQVVREKSTDEELVFVCPECGDKTGNRSLNLKTGLTFCWRCNKGKNNKGNFIAWAKALGYYFSSGSDMSSVSIADIFAQDDPAASKVPVLREVKLPKGFVPMAREPDSAYTKLITKMARRKHLDYEDFAAVGAGFTRDDLRWEPFCIFPVVEYGMTVYYQGRTYVDVPDETTKKFPSRRECPFGAKYWVYNIDGVRVQKPETVVVVESILNVLSLKRKFKEIGVYNQFVPVSVFKHYVSNIQALKLLQFEGVKEICLLFDHDAIEQTWKMIGTLGLTVTLTIAEMPFRKDNKKLDPNDDVEAACEALAERKLYSGAAAMKQQVRPEMDLSSIIASKGLLAGRRICSR
jgi:hypothetical protein